MGPRHDVFRVAVLAVALSAGACVTPSTIAFFGRPPNVDPERAIEPALQEALAAVPHDSGRYFLDGFVVPLAGALPTPKREALLALLSDGAQRGASKLSLRDAVEAFLFETYCPPGSDPPRSPIVPTRKWLDAFDARVWEAVGGWAEPPRELREGDGTTASARSLLRAQVLWRYCLREPAMEWDRFRRWPVYRVQAVDDWRDETFGFVPPWAGPAWLQEALAAEQAYFEKNGPGAAWRSDANGKFEALFASITGVHVALGDDAPAVLSRVAEVMELGRRYRGLATTDGDDRIEKPYVEPSGAWPAFFAAFDRDTPPGALGGDVKTLVGHMSDDRLAGLPDGWARRGGERADAWRDRVEQALTDAWCEPSSSGSSVAPWRIPAKQRAALLQRIAAPFKSPRALPSDVEGRRYALNASARAYLFWRECLRHRPLSDERLAVEPDGDDSGADELIAWLSWRPYRLGKLQPGPLPGIEGIRASLDREAGEWAERSRDREKAFAGPVDRSFRDALGGLLGRNPADGSARELYARVVSAQAVAVASACDALPSAIASALWGRVVDGSKLRWGDAKRWPLATGPSGTVECADALAASLAGAGAPRAGRLLGFLAFAASWDGVATRDSPSGRQGLPRAGLTTCGDGEALRGIEWVEQATPARPHFVLDVAERYRDRTALLKDVEEEVHVGWQEVRKGGPKRPPPSTSLPIDVLRARVAELRAVTRDSSERQRRLDDAARDEAAGNRNVGAKYRSWDASERASANFDARSDASLTLIDLEAELRAYDSWEYESRVTVERVPRIETRTLRVVKGNLHDRDATLTATRQWAGPAVQRSTEFAFRETEGEGTPEKPVPDLPPLATILPKLACQVGSELAKPDVLAAAALADLRANGPPGAVVASHAAVEQAAWAFVQAPSVATLQAFFAALAALPGP